MSFEERTSLANNMESALVAFLKSKKFFLEKTGFETRIPKEMRDILTKIHDNPTVRFLRYMPDYFAIFQGNFFFVEFKLMNSPIYSEQRVQDLKKISKIDDLSKENIGVIEKAAVDNYKNLSKIDVKIMVIVYCTFNPNRLLADWEPNLVTFFSDKVRIGAGNASFTPFTNVHLDKMNKFEDFMKKEFGVEIDKDSINSLITRIEKG